MNGTALPLASQRTVQGLAEGVTAFAFGVRGAFEEQVEGLLRAERPVGGRRAERDGVDAEVFTGTRS